MKSVLSYVFRRSKSENNSESPIDTKSQNDISYNETKSETAEINELDPVTQPVLIRRFSEPVPYTREEVTERSENPTEPMPNLYERSVKVSFPKSGLASDHESTLRGVIIDIPDIVNIGIKDRRAIILFLSPEVSRTGLKLLQDKLGSSFKVKKMRDNNNNNVENSTRSPSPTKLQPESNANESPIPKERADFTDSVATSNTSTTEVTESDVTLNSANPPHHTNQFNREPTLLVKTDNAISVPTIGSNSGTIRMESPTPYENGWIKAIKPAGYNTSNCSNSALSFGHLEKIDEASHDEYEQDQEELEASMRTKSKVISRDTFRARTNSVPLPLASNSQAKQSESKPELELRNSSRKLTRHESEDEPSFSMWTLKPPEALEDDDEFDIEPQTTVKPQSNQAPLSIKPLLHTAATSPAFRQINLRSSSEFKDQTGDGISINISPSSSSSKKSTGTGVSLKGLFPEVLSPEIKFKVHNLQSNPAIYVEPASTDETTTESRTKFVNEGANDTIHTDTNAKSLQKIHNIVQDAAEDNTSVNPSISTTTIRLFETPKYATSESSSSSSASKSIAAETKNIPMTSPLRQENAIATLHSNCDTNSTEKNYYSDAYRPSTSPDSFEYSDRDSSSIVSPSRETTVHADKNHTITDKVDVTASRRNSTRRNSKTNFVPDSHPFPAEAAIPQNSGNRTSNNDTSNSHISSNISASADQLRGFSLMDPNNSFLSDDDDSSSTLSITGPNNNSAIKKPTKPVKPQMSPVLAPTPSATVTITNTTPTAVTRPLKPPLNPEIKHKLTSSLASTQLIIGTKRQLAASSHDSDEGDIDSQSLINKLKRQVRLLEAEARVRERERQESESQAALRERRWITEMEVTRAHCHSLEVQTKALTEALSKAQRDLAEVTTKLAVIQALKYPSQSASPRSPAESLGTDQSHHQHQEKLQPVDNKALEELLVARVQKCVVTELQSQYTSSGRQLELLSTEMKTLRQELLAEKEKAREPEDDAKKRAQIIAQAVADAVAAERAALVESQERITEKMKHDTDLKSHSIRINTNQLDDISSTAEVAQTELALPAPSTSPKLGPPHSQHLQIDLDSARIVKDSKSGHELTHSNTITLTGPTSYTSTGPQHIFPSASCPGHSGIPYSSFAQYPPGLSPYVSYMNNTNTSTDKSNAAQHPSALLVPMWAPPYPQYPHPYYNLPQAQHEPQSLTSNNSHSHNYSHDPNISSSTVNMSNLSHVSMYSAPAALNTSIVHSGRKQRQGNYQEYASLNNLSTTSLDKLQLPNADKRSDLDEMRRKIALLKNMSTHNIRVQSRIQPKSLQSNHRTLPNFDNKIRVTSRDWDRGSNLKTNEVLSTTASFGSQASMSSKGRLEDTEVRHDATSSTMSYYAHLRR